MRPYIVGITGGSGSGKTTFIRLLMEKLGTDSVTLISQDNYYYPREQQPRDPKGIENFDKPESINFDNFYKDIISLSKGESLTFKEYTFNNPDAVAQTHTIHPSPILLAEGLFVFHHSPIKELVDLSIFIDAEDELRLQRRIIRDKEERGYDLDDVIYRIKEHHMPSYFEFILPHKARVDLVIPNNTDFSKALEVLSSFLKHKISNK